jgi:WD40 repeat protein
VREFGRSLHQRMPQLLRRERELAEIAAFATGPPGYRWLVGGAYAGKTALLYEAVTAGLPDDVDVVCYFLSRRASDADSSRFLAAVVAQLAYLCELDPPVADRDQFYALWRQAAERAAEVGRPLLLVVDGLDEDIRPAGLPSVASLLPTLVDGQAHVLVASRPHPELPIDVPDGHPLTPPNIRVDLKPFKGAEKLAELARQEIYDLTHGADADTAVDVLGLLTAAAGPLSVRDLAALSNDLASPSAAHSRRIRRLVTEQAARSLEPIGPAEQARYQFAHLSLLEYAQATEELSDSEYGSRIHQWAERWRDRGWPTSRDVSESTPRYLFDSYPGIFASESSRLAALVSDVGWIDVAIQWMGADRVLADLRRAAAASQTKPTVGAMLAIVSGQAHYLRPTSPITQPGYVRRQLWMQAAELGEDRLASDLHARLRSQPGSGLIPISTTRRSSRALSAELGQHYGSVTTVAVLPDGRVVSGAADRRVLVWDPARPGSDPIELGRHDDMVLAVVVLPDGRVVSGGFDKRVLVWDPARPGSDPVELGRQDELTDALVILPDGRVVSGGRDGRLLMWEPSGKETGPVELGRHRLPSGVASMALVVLPDGRVVSSGSGGRVLVRDPARPGSDPVELGRHDSEVTAVAVLPDGRLVSGGDDRQVLIWNANTRRQVAQLGCSAIGLAAARVGRDKACLVVAHAGQGFSLWSITKGTT